MRRIYYTDRPEVAVACALEVGKRYEATTQRAAGNADLREVGGTRQVFNVPVHTLKEVKR